LFQIEVQMQELQKQFSSGSPSHPIFLRQVIKAHFLPEKSKLLVDNTPDILLQLLLIGRLDISELLFKIIFRKDRLRLYVYHSHLVKCVIDDLIMMLLQKISVDIDLHEF